MTQAVHQYFQSSVSSRLLTKQRQLIDYLLDLRLEAVMMGRQLVRWSLKLQIKPLSLQLHKKLAIFLKASSSLERLSCLIANGLIEISKQIGSFTSHDAAQPYKPCKMIRGIFLRVWGLKMVGPL